MVVMTLYEAGKPDQGCVQSWHHWPHDLPVRGDVIRLDDGDWAVQYRAFNPSEDSVDVYATPPVANRFES